MDTKSKKHILTISYLLTGLLGLFFLASSSLQLGISLVDDTLVFIHFMVFFGGISLLNFAIGYSIIKKNVGFNVWSLVIPLFSGVILYLGYKLIMAFFSFEIL